VLVGGEGVPVFGSLVWKFLEMVTICHNDTYFNAYVLHPRLFSDTLSPSVFYYPGSAEIGYQVYF